MSATEIPLIGGPLSKSSLSWYVCSFHSSCLDSCIHSYPQPQAQISNLEKQAHDDRAVASVRNKLIPSQCFVKDNKMLIAEAKPPKIPRALYADTYAG